MDALAYDLARTRRPAGRQGIVRMAVYWGGMVPAAWGVYLGVTDQLGPNPIDALEDHLGIWALRFLILGLAITPLRRLGGPSLIPYRRAIGLLAFVYAALHLTVYLWLDQGFDMAAILGDIAKRPYITAGMLAFLILVPLAITSNNAMISRLGASAWRKLNRWVYLAAALGALHFLLLVKSWPPEPIVYCAIVAALLLLRLIPARRNRHPGAARH
jgi:sulfoxide reductase heme-binding subunit YedZ